MKKSITVLIMTLALWSCKQEEAKMEYVVLSGNIGQTDGGELRINGLDGFAKTVNIKDNGLVVDTLMVDEGTYFLSFEKKRATVYLKKGMSINFTADGRQFDKTVSFSGDLKNINNYFVEKSKIDLDFSMDRKENYALEERGFEELIAKHENKLVQKLNGSPDIPESFRNREIRSLAYNRLSKKMQYQSYHPWASGKKEFKASPAFLKEIEEMSFDVGSDYLYSAEYNQMVGIDIRNKAFDLMKTDSLPYLKAMTEAISQVKNDTIKNVELYKSFSMLLPMADNKKEALDAFVSLSTDQDQIKKIGELYNSLLKLEPGRPSPKFKDYENYAGGTTSLEDLLGKYVYIDVWATWCGPCKGEIPFLKKIEADYHDKNIEFVSISVDEVKDKDKWKKMIEDEGLTGIQLFAIGNFNADFIEQYKIRGIPRFILLDPEGNIVDSNAPRPSDDKLVELFSELNI